jgi:2-iminobutanoate/2-iminopropanoate deaminase
MIMEGQGEHNMSVKRIPTKHTYSKAVLAGDYVFLGLHRGSGLGFKQQFESAFEGLSYTLAEFELSLADIVKLTVWLKRIGDLPEMEKLFREYFDEGFFPARMTAKTEFIDDDCLLMIEGTAYADPSSR